jgi:hypothetical protein
MKCEKLVSKFAFQMQLVYRYNTHHNTQACHMVQARGVAPPVVTLAEAQLSPEESQAAGGDAGVCDAEGCNKQRSRSRQRRRGGGGDQTTHAISPFPPQEKNPPKKPKSRSPKK